MSGERTNRRGFTLVEIVLVLGALSLLLGLCAGLLHVLMRVDRIGRAHVVETATVGRLARQFRQDVHVATRAKPVTGDDGPVSRLELTLPRDRIVVYEASAHTLDRTQHHVASVERRETYTLPFCSGPRFQVRDEDGNVWVSLRLPRGTEPGPKGLRHDLRLDAVLGKDRRFSQPAEKETSP